MFYFWTLPTRSKTRWLLDHESNKEKSSLVPDSIMIYNYLTISAKYKNELATCIEQKNIP